MSFCHVNNGPSEKQALEGSGKAEPVQIRKARAFIQEHSHGAISLAEVARAANISANYLSERFKQVTGMNFVDCVARTRVERARNLLLSADLPITEIAFAAGFQSLSQFNRVFKKRLGQSPTEYRAAQPKT